MQPERFVLFAYNIGDPMTFNVIQCNEDMQKRNIVVHRDVVVPCSPTEIGYNYVLAPKSDPYFSVV